jgi:hypothetical protein
MPQACTEDVDRYAPGSLQSLKFAAVRDRLAAHLWWAMIAGPEAEKESWDTALREYGLRMDQQELVRRCYYERMRPRINNWQLTQLRQHFREEGLA